MRPSRTGLCPLPPHRHPRIQVERALRSSVPKDESGLAAILTDREGVGGGGMERDPGCGTAVLQAEYGGTGLGTRQQFHFREELAVPAGGHPGAGEQTPETGRGCRRGQGFPVTSLSPFN